MKNCETLTIEKETGQTLKEQISSLISSQTEESKNLVIPKVILKFTNHDLKTAALLSNLIYWTDQGKTGDELIERSPSEWYEETGLDWMDIHDGLESPEVWGVLSTEGRRPENYAQLKLDKKALIKTLQAFVKSDRNGIAYYKLSEDFDLEEIKDPLTFHDFLNLSRFFDEKLACAISTRLEMRSDYVGERGRKFYPRNVHRFTVKFPINRWIKICDAFSEMFNKAKDDSYMECILNEHCADPNKYKYCKNCFKQYLEGNSGG
jgi:hypothetical protein